MSGTLRNIGYNSVAKAITMLVGVVTSTILARNLQAEDYGVVGIAMIIIGFLGRFSDIGIGNALIQRPVNDLVVLETAQTLNVLLAGILFVCGLGAAPFAAVIFKTPAASPVAGILAITFLLAAIGFLPSALLTREMRFATLRLPAVVGTLLRGVISVTCALLGCKYWSLVAGSLAGSLTTSVLLRIVHPVKTKWRLDGPTAVELLRFGLPVWFSGILVFLVFNLDNFTIGSLMGAESLGFYTVALTWATYGSNSLYEIVHSVLFPRFSREQGNRAEVRQMYLRSLRVVVFAAVMTNAALFSVAGGFLVTILGKGSTRWLPAEETLRILCLYGVLRASTEPVGNVVMALGRPKLLLWAVLLPIACEVCLLPVLAMHWGLKGVAWLVSVAYATQWIVYGPFLARELRVGVLDLARIAGPVAGAAMGSVWFARWLQPSNSLAWTAVGLTIVIVCVVFILLHELLSGGGVLREIRGVLAARKVLLGPADRRP